MNIGASISSPQSWNAYAYVDNNPLNRVDPLGLRASADIDGMIYGAPFGTTNACGDNSDTCVIVKAKPDDGPSLITMSVAVGHHFVDQAIIKAEGAWNSLAGRFFRRWTTGGPLKTPGVHTGYPEAARLNTQQIQKIVNDVKQVTGRDMAQWTESDIQMAVDEVRAQVATPENFSRT